MFSRFKPVPFEPYGRRRSRARVPGWLVLLVFGIAAGAAGVLLLQQHYLPPRLTASESAALRDAYQQADTERQQLQARLAETSQRLESAQATSRQAADELQSHRADVARLRDEVGSLVEALPSDPRGGRIEVRAGQFSTKGSTLAYEVVLTRESRQGAAPTTGVMQLAVAGDAPRGADNTITTEPVQVSVGSHQIVHGSVELPEGFKPRETTIRILDRPAGEQLGMRVLRVR